MNELKTLIDLCPGTRLPHYEQEIFSDKDLTDHYLHKLCEHHGRSGRGDSVPRMVYYYARFVMKCRWSEAEHLIATNDICRKWYNYTLGANV